MRRSKLFAALALALVATAIAVPVYATHSGEAGVQATVTPAFLSVTFIAQNVAYGDVDLNTTGAVPSGQVGTDDADAAFEVKNNGTTISDWEIVGGPTLSTDWTIAATADNNVYAHFYDDEATGVAPTTPVSLHSSTTLASSVALGASVFVWLELNMPTDCSPGSTCDEQTLPITITASATP